MVQGFLTLHKGDFFMVDHPIPHFTLEFSQKFIETCPDDVLAALYHIWHSLDLHNYFINALFCVRSRKFASVETCFLVFSS